MKTYLVDFENVKSKGLSGIDRLTEDDHVIIFYSENSDTISFEMHCMVLQAKADVDYMKVRVGGKNALDFQLSTLLGYLVAKGDNSHIFVISNDRGFDKLHDFWENTFDDSPGCKVFRTANISAAINYAKYNTAPVEEEEPGDIEDRAEIETIAEEAEESYTEDGKTIEIDLGGSGERGEDGAMVIPENMVGEVIASAPSRHTSEYVGEQSVTRPLSHQKKPVEIAATVSLPKMPKVIAPGVRHPMLLANESQAELYEPLFEEFLRMPAAKDKQALLADFMRGADKSAVTLMSELILASSSKSELHNMLQQNYDNDTAARLYNMVKSNYYFLKRVLRGDNAPAKTEEEAPAAAAVPASAPAPAPVQEKPKPAAVQEKLAAAVQEKPSAAVQEKPSAAVQEKPAAAPEKPAEPAEPAAEKPQEKKPAAKKNAKADKPEKAAAEKQSKQDKQDKQDKQASGGGKKRTSGELAEPKKVDNEMKKRLHELLDSKADADEFSGVISVINASASRQQLYINMMQRFNRTRGRELYGIIKDEYMRFTAEERSKQTAKPAKEKKEKDKEKEKTAKSEKPEKPAKAAKTEKPEKTEKADKPAAEKKQPGKQKPPAKTADMSYGDAEKRLRELCGGELVDDAEFMRLKNLVADSETTGKLYRAMLKTFGKSRGSAMYNAVKPEFGTINAALSEGK